MFHSNQYKASGSPQISAIEGKEVGQCLLFFCRINFFYSAIPALTRHNEVVLGKTASPCAATMLGFLPPSKISHQTSSPHELAWSCSSDPGPCCHTLVFLQESHKLSVYLSARYYSILMLARAQPALAWLEGKEDGSQSIISPLHSCSIAFALLGSMTT